MFKVIVAGSRDFYNYDLVCEKLDYLLRNKDDVCIICGMAQGADSLGQEYAINHRTYIKYYPADWNKHGKKAGILRNIEMAENADALVAFWDGESRGTKHMIEVAKEKGLEVRVVYV